MSVFDYILDEESTYQTTPVPIVEGYEWSMFKHVQLTTLYLNSQYESGNNDSKPFQQIILQKVNLQHRAVELDVKDIEPFVNSSKDYYKSFLVKKFHPKWARETNLSEFLNDLTETFTDYGGALVKKTKGGLEVVPFQRLAFVDQTDMMSGPICEKHYMTPDQIMEFSGLWGEEKNGADNSLEDLIRLSSGQDEKENSQSSDERVESPAKYIEVYELHGNLPESFLNDEADENKYSNQIHIVAFYKDEKGDKQGISLFAKEEKNTIYDAVMRDKIYGRALGRGGVEELFEAQVWVNYSAIQQKELLDQAAKIIYQTADPAFANRNQTSDMDNGEILTYAEGKPITPINNSPVNIPAFTNVTELWDNTAKEISSAFDTIAGDVPKSGTPFRLGALVNQEAASLHRYRKEKLGIFIRRLYKNWVLPDLVKEMRKGDEFIVELSLQELEGVVQQIVSNSVNIVVKERILNGEAVLPEEVDQLEQEERTKFLSDNKKIVKIAKDEFKDIPIDVDIIITGEQKNNAFIADKLSAVFAQVAQNPQILQNPEMSRLFNEILEASGLSPVKYGVVGRFTPQVATAPQQLPPAQAEQQPVAQKVA